MEVKVKTPRRIGFSVPARLRPTAPGYGGLDQPSLSALLEQFGGIDGINAMTPDGKLPDGGFDLESLTRMFRLTAG